MSAPPIALYTQEEEMKKTAIVAFVLVLLCSGMANATPFFIGLGDLPGGITAAERLQYQGTDLLL